MTTIQTIKNVLKQFFLPKKNTERSPETVPDLSLPHAGPDDAGILSLSPPLLTENPNTAAMPETGHSRPSAHRPPPVISDGETPLSGLTFSIPSFNRHTSVNRDDLIYNEGLMTEYTRPSFFISTEPYPPTGHGEMRPSFSQSTAASFPMSPPSYRETIRKDPIRDDLVLTADAPGRMTERGDFTALPSSPGNADLHEIRNQITETASGVAAIGELLRDFEQEFHT